LKERYTGRENEEEDVSSYWMTLRKSDDIGIRKRKQCMGLCAGPTFEEAMYQP
jgi:hypothetical protein